MAVKRVGEIAQKESKRQTQSSGKGDKEANLTACRIWRQSRQARETFM